MSRAPGAGEAGPATGRRRNDSLERQRPAAGLRRHDDRRRSSCSGCFSYRDLGLDLMPKTDSPIVNVRRPLPGASAEEIETQITKPIEEAVNTISGIDELRAAPTRATSRVTITFTLERDIESATQDVRDKVATDRPAVPARHRCRRSIQKIDPDAAPILTLRRLRPAIAEGDHRDRRQADQAGARDGRRTSVRSAAAAIAGARSSSCSTPTA